MIPRSLIPRKVCASARALAAGCTMLAGYSAQAATPASPTLPPEATKHDWRLVMMVEEGDFAMIAEDTRLTKHDGSWALVWFAAMGIEDMREQAYVAPDGTRHIPTVHRAMVSFECKGTHATYSSFVVHDFDGSVLKTSPPGTLRKKVVEGSGLDAVRKVACGQVPVPPAVEGLHPWVYLSHFPAGGLPGDGLGAGQGPAR